MLALLREHSTWIALDSMGSCPPKEMGEGDTFNDCGCRIALTAAWLAQLVERRTAVQEVEGSNPRPNQPSGS